MQFGDLLEFVDFDYVARVAKVNAATMWALATGLAMPKNLQIHTTPPVGFAGINTTTLTWNANPEPNLAGYEVVMRETTSADWTDSTDVGNVTSVTLDISKDNVQFGVRAVDQAWESQPGRVPAGGRLVGRLTCRSRPGRVPCRDGWSTDDVAGDTQCFGLSE